MAGRTIASALAAARRPLAAPLAGQRGMALLLTVLLLAVLVSLTLYLQRRTAANMVAATVFRDDMRLGVAADSAVRVGLAILAVEGATDRVDTLVDPWATVDEGQLSTLFAEDEVKLDIIDLSGRLQLNSLVATSRGEDAPSRGRVTVRQRQAREVLLRLLASGRFAIAGEGEARRLVDAVVDWLDADDREEQWGAENSYYQALDRPYSCRNGPLGDLDELLLVRGMSRVLLYGTSSTEALADYLTVYGDDGRININTAPRLLVSCLAGDLDENLLSRFDGFRQDPRHRSLLAEPRWYKNIGGWPGDIVLYDDLLKTASDHFLVTATASHRVSTRGVTVVAQRGEGGELRLRLRKVQ